MEIPDLWYFLAYLIFLYLIYRCYCRLDYPWEQRWVDYWFLFILVPE